MLRCIDKNIHESIMNPLQDFLLTSTTRSNIIYFYIPMRSNEFTPVITWTGQIGRETPAKELQ